MKKKVLAVLMVAALAVGVAAGCGGNQSSSSSAPAASASGSAEAEAPAAEGEYVLKCGSTTPDTHPYNLGINKLSELLQEKTNGAAKVDMFGSSQLGGERDLIEGLQLGTVEMCVISTAPLSGFTDDFLVFDLPFIFETNEQARAVMDSEVGTEILNSVAEQGLIGVCWFENGFRNVSNNVRPITVPEDLKGLKIRTMENQMHMACFQIMGADPTPMAMGEVFTACQQGTIDGEENPVPIIESNKLDEVQKYVSLTGHLFSPAPVFVGETYYSTLPADIQTAIMEAGAEAVDYQRQQIDEQTASGLEIMAERTGLEWNEVDKAPFKEATAPLYDQYIKDEAGCVNPDIYARVMEVVEAN